MSVEASNYVAVMKQWREALGKVYDNVSFYDEVRQAIESIDQAIARAERSAEGTLEAEKHSATHGEPMAWIHKQTGVITTGWSFNKDLFDPLYDHPQSKREWVGLTDDEIDLAIGVVGSFGSRQDARAIEAKLKEKNT